MTFRRKLLVIFTLTVILSVGAVAWLVQAVTRGAFEKSESERTATLVAQFQREFDRRGDDVAQRVQAIATSDPVIRMASALSGTPADSAEYFDLGRSMAESHQLDFLELVDERGVIISSAQSPAKFGYPESGFDNLAGLNQEGAFLKLEELQDSSATGLFAVRATRAGDHPVYVIGGRRLDKTFLAALELPPDMRALLYQNRGDRFSADHLLAPNASGGTGNGNRPAEKFEPLIG